ncbi:hypothetical protein KRMM14A1004_15240 [Krasilnikovia sp. MM14-A1004]
MVVDMVDMGPDLMGAHEIRVRLGVSRQRTYQLTLRSDFPAPAAKLAMGKVWLAQEIERWITARRLARSAGDRRAGSGRS